MPHVNTDIKIDRPMPDSIKQVLKDKSQEWAARVAKAKANHDKADNKNVSTSNAGR